MAPSPPRPARRRTACVLAVSVALLAAAAPASGVTPTGEITPGESQNIPVSSGWEVILSVCGQIGTTGPTGSTFQIVPDWAGTFTNADAGRSIGTSDSLGFTASPDVRPGLVIGLSWTSFANGCFSAHGGITLTVVAPKSAASPPGSGGSSSGGGAGTQVAAPPVSAQGTETATPAETPRSVSRTEFADTALSLARDLIPLIGEIRRTSDRPSRLGALLAKLERRAVSVAAVFDLARLAKPSGWRKSGVKLRSGQIRALPGFAARLKKISEYDKLVLDKTDRKYATDPRFRADVDRASTLQLGRPYAQLSPDEKLKIARRFQAQSGARDALLRLARSAARSAARVVSAK